VGGSRRRDDVQSPWQQLPEALKSDVIARAQRGEPYPEGAIRLIALAWAESVCATPFVRRWALDFGATVLGLFAVGCILVFFVHQSPTVFVIVGGGAIGSTIGTSGRALSSRRRARLVLEANAK
jgi:hypothetical protein